MAQYLINKLKNDIFTIGEDEAHHLVKVLRCKSGDEIKIFDGCGNQYLGEVLDIDKKKISGKILSKLENKTLSAKVNLFFSPIAPKQTEDILDKGTQLGVDTFQPIITQYTQKIDVKIFEEKIKRLSSILVSSCKQCERASIPNINSLLYFTQAIKLHNNNSFLCYEKESNNYLSDKLDDCKNVKSINIFIGPAGGFSYAEIEEAKAENIQLVSLGTNILRVETACTSSISLVIEHLLKQS